MNKKELKRLEKAIAYLYSGEDDAFTDGMNELHALRNSALSRRRTPRAADGAYCDCEVPTPSTTKFCHFCYRPVAPRN